MSLQAWRELVTCKICNRFFDNPINITCHTICAEHLQSLKIKETNQIRCSICARFIDDSKGFVENEEFKKIIEQGHHLFPEEKNFKNKANKILSDKKKLTQQFLADKEGFESFSQSYFKEAFQKIETLRCKHIETINASAILLKQNIENLKRDYQHKADQIKLEESSINSDHEKELILKTIFLSTNIQEKNDILKRQEAEKGKIKKIVDQIKTLKIELLNFRPSENFEKMCNTNILPFASQNISTFFQDSNRSSTQNRDHIEHSHAKTISNAQTQNQRSPVNQHQLFSVPEYDNILSVSCLNSKNVSDENNNIDETLNSKSKANKRPRLKSNDASSQDDFFIEYESLLNRNVIVSCSDDKSVKVWDFNNGMLKRTFTEHKKGVICVKKFSTDKIASCSNDKTVKVWDLNSTNTNKSLKTLKHQEGVVSIGFLNLQTMVSATHDLYLWDWESGKLIKQKAHEKEMDINRIEIKSNFEFVTCSKDATIKLWDTRTDDSCVQIFSEHEEEIECIKLLSEFKLASGSRDETIIFWDLRKLKKIDRIIEKTCVWDLDVCENGNMVSCTYNGSINLWRKHSDVMKIHETKKNAHDANEPAISRIKMFSNDILVTCSDDNKIKYWDLKEWNSKDYMPKTYDNRHNSQDGIWCID